MKNVRVVYVQLNSNKTVCEYWDCGWCYHPDNISTSGCVGIDKCILLY